MTYTDALRLYFRGDKEKAKRYVQEARRLAFLLFRTTAESGAKQARRRWHAADGTYIEIIIAGMEVTAIIDVPLEKGKKPEPIDDFVVFARTTGLPDGIDPDNPEQILRPPSEEIPSWTTFFYNADTIGFDAFPGRKGTYQFERGIEIFPDGVHHAGNVDWRGTNGERLSWYGPENRYWYDTWRQPSAQYGKFVFHLGQILLDVEQYQIDNGVSWDEQLVTGAAIRKHGAEHWLYVVMAEMPDLVIPPYNIVGPEVYFSENFPMYQVYFAIRRFRLAYDPVEKLADQWSIAPGSGEDIWYASGWRMCNPWVFNRDGTKLTTFAQPESPLFVFDEADSGHMFAPPPAEADRLDVMIAEDATVTYEVSTVSMPPFSGRAMCAIDYDEEGTEIGVFLGREPYDASPNAVHLYIGDTRYPLWYYTAPPGGYNQKSVRRRILNIDARENLVVFSTYTLSVNMTAGAFFENILFEIAQDGNFTVSEQVNQNSGPSGGWDLYADTVDAAKEYPTSPFGWLWMLHAVAAPGVVRATIMGNALPNSAIPYRVAETFGQFGARTIGNSGPATQINTLASDTFNNNVVDNHGKYISSSTAAREGIMVGSVRNPGQDFNVNPVSTHTLHFATRSSLPVLTGVSGAEARYHLVWLLGQPIETPLTSPP